MTKGQDFIQPEDLAQFFARHNDLALQPLSIFFGRPDGVLLFTRLAENLSGDQESSLGVLLASAWQASQAMANYFPVTKSEEFRYSFATADQGIYLVAFPWHRASYFLAVLYQGQDNPGAIKLLLRSTAWRLREFLIGQHSEQTTPAKATTSPEDAKFTPEEKPLFNDITDDEMNKLFAFAENN